MENRKKKKTETPETHMELVLTNGDRYTITGETEKYHLCGETQFRKNNPRIARVENVADATFEEVAEPGEKPDTDTGETDEESEG